jgi:hypothetical protein
MRARSPPGARRISDASSPPPKADRRHRFIAVLRNNGLIETDGRRYRTAVLFRE